MKKIILAGLLFSGSLFANEANTKTTKEFLIDMKEHTPILHTICNDYFQAKTCSTDISKKVSIKELKEFFTTAKEGQLALLKFDEKILSQKRYDALISSYKFMNCGDIDELDAFTDSLASMSVEQNSVQK